VRLAGILAVGVLGGCTIIFDSGNLPRIADASVDAMPDAPPPADARIFDVNPNGLTLASVDPPALVEGTGTAGGRAAVLVVTGTNIDATATLSIVAGSDPVPTGLTMMASTVSHDHATIAAPVIVPEIGALADGAKLSLMVEVTSLGETKQLPLELDGLDAFAPSGTVDVSSLKPQYSSATFSSNVHFIDTTKLGPAHVKVTGGITIGAVVDVDGGTGTAGPGGCAGGTGTSVGECGTSVGGNGASGVSGAAGGGGGFATPGSDGTGTSNNGKGGMASGDPNLVQLYGYSSGEAGNRGNGGGGGGGATLGTAGLGGGGGGTIELEAGGTITINSGGAVRAQGGAGTKGSGVTPGGDGGAGTGGAILIRSQTAIAATPTNWISAPPGGNPSGSKGGAGSVGRVRVDAPSGTVASMANNPVAVQGPSWVTGGSGAPLIVGTPTAMIPLLGKSGATYGIVVDASPQASVMLTATTMKDVTVPLTVGHNAVCAVADAQTPSSGNAEALECIDVVYIP
jgi:hypothetical protein